MVTAAAHGRRATLGADKAYDAAEHVAQNLSGKRSAIDARTTRHPGYAISQRIRKRIESPSAGSKPQTDYGKPVIEGSAVSDGSLP